MHKAKPSDQDLNAALERLSAFIDQNSSQGEPNTFLMKEFPEEAGEREGDDNSIVNSMRMIANLIQSEERIDGPQVMESPLPMDAHTLLAKVSSFCA